LPKEAIEDAENDREKIEAMERVQNGRGTEGLPWFETLVEGSRLGRMRKSSGKRQSRDGRFQVEWEIVEWNGEGDEESLGTGKRKLGEVEEDDRMEGH